MKKLLLITFFAALFIACNSNNEGANNGDPNKVHPQLETIPDSLKLVNDSTFVPDTIPGNGSVGANDGPARQQQ